MFVSGPIIFSQRRGQVPLARSSRTLGSFYRARRVSIVRSEIKVSFQRCRGGLSLACPFHWKLPLSNDVAVAGHPSSQNPRDTGSFWAKK